MYCINKTCTVVVKPKIKIFKVSYFVTGLYMVYIDTRVPTVIGTVISSKFYLCVLLKTLSALTNTVR